MTTAGQGAGLRNNSAIAWLAVALAIGAFVRFWNLTSHSLYLDEAFAFQICDQSFPKMMHQIVYNDFHPPLFYVATYYLMKLLHWQPWNYRFLTAPFGLVTIVATWAIARRLFGNTAGAIAALLVAVEPSLVEWDRLYRMYSVLVALTAVSWWLLLTAERAKGRAALWWWSLYGVVAILQPYVHYLGGVMVLCQTLYAFGNVRRRWPLFVSSAAVVLAFIPWLWALQIQYPNGGTVGRPDISLDWLYFAQNALIDGFPLAMKSLLVFATAFTAAAAAIAVAASYLGRKTLLPFWLCAFLMQAAGTLFFAKSLLVPRYLLAELPALLIASAAVCAALLGTKFKLAGVAIVSILVTISVLSTQSLLLDPYYQFSDWYLVNAVVLQHEQKNDVMVFVQGYPYLVVGSYTAFRKHLVRGPAMPSDIPPALRWVDQHKAQRIWYIENQYYFADPAKKIKNHLDKTRRLLGVWSEKKDLISDQVNIVLYGSAGTAPKRSNRLGYLKP